MLQYCPTVDYFVDRPGPYYGDSAQRWQQAREESPAHRRARLMPCDDYLAWPEGTTWRAPQRPYPCRQQLQPMLQPPPQGVVRCDRCDEAHETSRCPHFKQDREKHTDAWQSYSGSAPGRTGRRCDAPRSLPRQAYDVRRMPGDGSCLFHSLAFGLQALGFRHDNRSIRNEVSRFIADNPNFEITGTPLRCWVDWDSRMTVESYAARLSAGSFWGGAIEMAACAQIFLVDIVVYEADYRSGGVLRISDFLVDAKGASPRGTVMVLYSGRSHYDALQLRAGAIGSQQGSAWRSYASSDEGGDGEEEDESSLCSLM